MLKAIYRIVKTSAVCERKGRAASACSGGGGSRQLLRRDEPGLQALANFANAGFAYSPKLLQNCECSQIGSTPFFQRSPELHKILGVSRVGQVPLGCLSIHPPRHNLATNSPGTNPLHFSLASITIDRTKCKCK